MYRLMNLLVIVVVGLMFTGCAATNREYARVHKTLEVDRLFRQGIMYPQYRYFYNGPASEPIALLALDRSYSFSSRFWTEFDDESQLRNWMEDFRRLTGDWDDIEYVVIDYEGSEILSRENARIGMAYSRYDWIVVWWGEGGELVIPPPRPSNSQRGPRIMRGRW